MTPALVSLKEAGIILGLSAKSVGRMIKRRELGYIPLGVKGIHKRIPVSDISAWIKKNVIHTPGEEKRVLDRRCSLIKNRMKDGYAT